MVIDRSRRICPGNIGNSTNGTLVQLRIGSDHVGRPIQVGKNYVGFRGKNRELACVDVLHSCLRQLVRFVSAEQRRPSVEPKFNYKHSANCPESTAKDQRERNQTSRADEQHGRLGAEPGPWFSDEHIGSSKGKRHVPNALKGFPSPTAKGLPLGGGLTLESGKREESQRREDTRPWNEEASEMKNDHKIQANWSVCIPHPGRVARRQYFLVGTTTEKESQKSKPTCAKKEISGLFKRESPVTTTSANRRETRPQGREGSIAGTHALQKSAGWAKPPVRSSKKQMVFAPRQICQDDEEQK
ncbi:hypothetical protein K438DRAFT_1779500 [Mycena galopus ATCC 62051]|nr:hypothetical protein K438DRAFT_1779500 [Mycena galopus ATCC 62051]